MVTAVCLALALFSAPKTSAELEAEAARAYAAGELAESLRLIQAAYALDPSPALLNNVGVALEASGRYSEAADAYRRVVADPRSPAKLRELDQKRLETIAPKLSRAWLRLSVLPEGAVVLADGAPYAGGEVAVEPGGHVIEVYDAASREVVLRFVVAVLGARIEVSEDLAAPKPDDAWVQLDQVTALAVDDYHLQTPGLDSFDRLRLNKGRYYFAGRARVQTSPIARHVDLAPQQLVTLAELPRAEVAPPRTETPLLQEIPERSPADGETSLWPAILAGGGVAAAVTGGILFAVASSDRATVDDAESDGRGVITSLTYAEAGALEESADRNATIGFGLALAGGALIASGIVWWLAEDAGE